MPKWNVQLADMLGGWASYTVDADTFETDTEDGFVYFFREVEGKPDEVVKVFKGDRVLAIERIEEVNA